MRSPVAGLVLLDLIKDTQVAVVPAHCLNIRTGIVDGIESCGHVVTMHATQGMRSRP